MNLLDGIVRSSTDGDTADTDAMLLNERQSPVRDLRSIDRLTMTPLLQETGLEEQASPDPTPTTLIGLQSNPRTTSRSWRTTPMDFRMGAAATDEAYERNSRQDE